MKYPWRRVTPESPAGLRARTHFIVSAPRSGSSWLRAALNHHPDILATEQRLFGGFCEIWPNGDGSTSPRVTVDEFAKQFAGFSAYAELGLEREAFSEALRDALIDTLLRFSFTRTRKQILVDKITPYLGTSPLVLDRVARHFPVSRVVQLVRDGRDVAVSGVFDWITRTAQGTRRHAFFVERRNDVVLDRFFDDDSLIEWARYWSEPIAAFEARMPDAPLLRYEEMKRDLGAVLDNLCGQLDVSRQRDDLEKCVSGSTFRILSGGRDAGDAAPLEKVRKGVVGDWRHYFTRHDGALFDELVGEPLRRLGYESDDRWYEALPEVLAPVARAGDRTTVDTPASA